MLNDDLKSLEILALKSREKPDFESEMRKIQRWFSKSFSTPLKDVEQMDIHYLISHKYEDFINSLSEEDYVKYKAKLLYPEIIEKKEEEDDDWMDQELKKELEAEQAKLKKAKEEAELNLPESFDIEF